ncbi:DUF2285 domain-containing protein [Filomicrobium sp.]|uniref:DNA -binding domain-containing protein n=1 Tax=Filomicrobium sp. TaxID=2024831 RepID=UPI0025903401|nr:DUF2285 domain-containing protein [Filomicrobium sp.]
MPRDLVKRLNFQDEPPQSAVLTNYDREHLKTYLRLLDSEADGACWEEAVSVIFGLDARKDPGRAERVYASHLARAKWMTDNGYRNLIRASYH